LRLKIRRHLRIALLAIVISAVAAAPAAASSGSSVIADCNKHLRLTGTYSIAELQNALQTLPADIAEYSNCKDVIQRALLVAQGKAAGSGDGGTGGSSGGSALPTPLIVVLVVLALGAVTLGAVAIRRRRTT
jgi:hypothetical protein